MMAANRPSFVPPDAVQVAWMLDHDAHRSYLVFVTYVHQLLCLYAKSHGLPAAIGPRESLLDFENGRAGHVKAFELEAAQRGSTYNGIVLDIAENKRLALDLHFRLLGSESLDDDAEAFLGSVLDAYGFVTIAAKRWRRP